LTYTTTTVLGAVFNLNNPAHTVDWHFIHLSVSNVVVIGMMLLVFVLAILLPFPGASGRQASRRAATGGPLDGGLAAHGAVTGADGPVAGGATGSAP
jgi:hypothetical protein